MRFVDWVGGAHSFIKPQLVVVARKMCAAAAAAAAAVVLNVMDCWQRINWRGYVRENVVVASKRARPTHRTVPCAGMISY